MRSSLILILLIVSGCSSFSFPGVHKISIQQGNVVTQQMIDKLKPGMTKSQVRFVLGNAIIDDSLDKQRWDYIYTIQLAGQKPFQKNMSLYFVDGRLDRFEGDYLPTSQQPEKAASSDS
jgi:outer membrane protein assembly factor BamE